MPWQSHAWLMEELSCDHLPSNDRDRVQVMMGHYWSKTLGKIQLGERLLEALQQP